MPSSIRKRALATALHFGLLETPPPPRPALAPEPPPDPADAPLPEDIPPPPRLAEAAAGADDIPVFAGDIPCCIEPAKEPCAAAPWFGEACLNVTGPRLAPRAAPSIPPGPEEYTAMLAEPCLATLFETPRKSPSDPRGTPSPAEFFSNTKSPGVLSRDIAIGVWFASTIEGELFPGTSAGAAGRVGARTTPFAAAVEAKPVPVGAKPLPAILFNPTNVPPGCHPHPYPG